MRPMKIYLALFFLGAQFTMPELLDASGISGKVNFTGAVPEAKSVAMSADPTCVEANKSAVVTPEVVVDQETLGLKNVFVYVKDGLKEQSFETPKEPVKLEQSGCMYEPRVFGIQIGQPLELVSHDPTLHNVHSLPKKQKPFNLGMAVPGKTITKKFTKPEVMVAFKCDVHPWMRAYAGVLTHPFFAVTNDQGNFDIKNLPSGVYTLEAWHEKYGVQTSQVTVNEGAATQIEFDFQGN